MPEVIDKAYLRLIDALHRGPLDEPLWADFLLQLREMMGADYVSFAFRNFKAPMTEVVELWSSASERSESQHAYLEKNFSGRTLPYGDMIPGRVYSMDALLDRGNRIHLRYIDEYLAARGHRFMRVMRILEANGANAWLAIYHQDRDFSKYKTDLFESLAPYLETAFRYFTIMETERNRAAIAREVVNRLNFSEIYFAKSGEIIEMDEFARNLLTEADLLHATASGELRLTMPYNNNILKEALGIANRAANARPKAIHVCDDPWLDMLILPVRKRMISGTAAPTAVGYLHADFGSLPDRQEQLSDLFGLNRSEALLALALCRGRSIAEAADDIGLTLETTRNYSKRLYAKTGARGQADLVRLILGSVVVLA